MTESLSSLRTLLDPVPPERFFAEIQHRTWLHASGPAERFAPLMSWPELNRILDMDAWNPQTMQLVLDRRRVPPGAYCRSGVDRNRVQAMRPDADRVQQLLRQGASLLLNDVETLQPEILQLVRVLQDAIGAKAAANLYLSWPQRQAFDSHYDRHDVFVAQVLGRKRWRIYAGRAEHPIDHPMFQNIPQAEYDRMKGPVAEEVVMEPGHLLYLPRGQFHDALAEGGSSLHITFSVSEPKGLDWLNDLWAQTVADPLFRDDLPRPEDPEFEPRLAAMLERLRALALSPEGLERARALRPGFGVPRGRYTLPPSPEGAAVATPQLARAVRQGLRRRG